MRFSEATGRKVVSTSDAATVGLIGGFVVDPAQRRVVALTLTKTSGPGSVLPWPEIQAFGADAVTVSSAGAAVPVTPEIAELEAKSHALLRKRVLTTAGYQIGVLRDVEFDPATGALVTLLLESGEWDGQALLGSGSYAVVVRA